MIRQPDSALHSTANRRLRFIQTVALALVGSMFSASIVLSQVDGQPAPFQELNRHIYVPFENLSILLDRNSNRVLLTQTEYESLLASAKIREIKQAPLDSAIISARYTGTIEAGIAQIKGTLIVEPLNDGLIQIPLSLSGVAIRSARLGDKPAKLWRNPAGQIVLLTMGKTPQTLEIELTVPVQTTAARQSLTLQLPATSATQFSLTASGNVEIKSGAVVVERAYNETGNLTTFDLLVTREPMDVVLSLNNRELKDDQVVVSRSVIIHNLTPLRHELHVTCSLDVIHGAIEEINFAIPAGFDVSAVTAELLSQWEVIDPATAENQSPSGVAVSADDGIAENRTGNAGRRLVVKLRQPTRDPFVVSIVAGREQSNVGGWTLPIIRPIDVVGEVAVVGLLADVGLRSTKLESTGLIPIDHQFLLAAIPASMSVSGSSSSLKVLAAFYAPQREYSITDSFSIPDPELVVKSSSRLVIENQRLELQTGLSLTSRHDSRFDFKLTLPKTWRLNELQDSAGSPVRFDRLDSKDRAEFLIRLSTRISAEMPTKLFLKASQTPLNWLEKWDSNTVEFPELIVAGQTKHTGTIAVVTAEDFAIKPTKFVNLELLDEADNQEFKTETVNAPLAYRFGNSKYELSLELNRLRPTITGRSYNFYSIQPNQLVVHGELIYEVKQAACGEFRFELPLSTPSSISIQSPEDQLKDYRSEETDSTRVWTVQLARPRLGNIPLHIDFANPLADADRQRLTLSPFRMRDVAFQSSMLAIEGNSELDIEVETTARVVDIGELNEAQYQPGSHTLGAYSSTDEKLAVTVNSVRRPVYSLPTAIVERAEMVTSISNNGAAITAARFLLATQQQPFLRIELPPKSVLWAVRLDGLSAKPQRRGDALLISLVGSETEQRRDLQLVFESPVKPFRFVGQIAASAPTLWLVDGVDDSGQEGELKSKQPVPLVDLHWQLLTPDGFTVSDCSANFQSEQLVQLPSPVEQLGSWIYRLGGGVGWNVVRMYWRSNYKRALTMESSPQSWEAISTGNVPDTSGADSKSAGPTISPSSNLDSLGGLLGKTGDAGIVAPPIAAPSEGKDSQMAWALSGLRSLNIELTKNGNSMEFYSLGEQTTLNATIVNQSRLNWVAITIALLIAAFGVLITNGRLNRKLFFLVLIFMIVCALPLLGSAFDALSALIDLTIMTLVFVAIYYLVVAIIKFMLRYWRTPALQIPVMILSVALTLGTTGPANAQQVIDDVNQLGQLNSEFQAPLKVNLPDDAVIIPFDSTDANGPEQSEKRLLPYQYYLNLLQAGESNEKQNQLEQSPKLPVDFVFSAAEYELQLNSDESVTVEGQLTIELFSDDPVSVELPFRGGAMIDATVDGQPARLHFHNSTAELPTDSGYPRVQLHLSNKGTKVVKFAFQIKPTRAGGWRILDGQLPVGLSRKLNLKSLSEPTEIRINTDADQRSIEAEPDQRIQTVLSADGSFQLQWKPSSTAQMIDQSLTATSEALFDVREDGLRLSWQVELDFRGSERDRFTLKLPTAFLVERIHGDNIRAWKVTENQAENLLSVTLLDAAKDREAFTIELSHRDFVATANPVSISVPYLTVDGAALHQGVYTIRRSPIIALKTLALQAANRIEANLAECRLDLTRIDAQASPLGIESYQIFQFVTTPFQIGLQVNLVPPSFSATTQTILRIGRNEAEMEAKINVTIGARPIYGLSLILPRAAEIRKISAGLNETWSAEQTDVGQQIQLTFPSGVDEDFSILLDARLTDLSDAAEWPIPQIKINGADKQTGELAIQVDPAISVTAVELNNCENLLRQQLDSWLNPDQRSITGLALRIAQADYSGKLRFAKIEPRISVETVTNIRTTLFAIEETLLLDFNIQQAGIRQIQFEIPAEMRNARIIAKLVRETTITDVADNPQVVRITLDLQDDVIDNFRIVIENDRPLSDMPQPVPMPRVLTGVTEQRYATLQNAGRDEIDVLESPDFRPLNRELSQFAQLKQKLAGGELTLAYFVQSDAIWPTLQFVAQRRESLETVAASIEFAKTTMIVDSSGAYRALQNFQVNNRSEQYLEIEMPVGATLLTTVVAGQSVKPVAWPAAQNDRRLRIPLVKTPLGELDYSVQLKYAGQLGDLANFRLVSFPVIETLNINVQLSQLHLQLPESHHWLNFDGTMTKVDDQGELEESYLSYKAQQIQSLAEQIQSKASSIGSFSKSRAYKNLGKLEKELAGLQTQESHRSSGKLQELIKGNAEAIRQAQQDYSVEIKETDKATNDNRALFNGLIETQSAKIARNTRNDGNQNFIQPDESKKEQPGKGQVGSFDDKWFSRNGLEGEQTEISQSESQPAQTLDDAISFRNPAISVPMTESVSSETNEDLAESAGGQLAQFEGETEEALGSGGMGGGGMDTPMGMGKGMAQKAGRGGRGGSSSIENSQTSGDGIEGKKDERELYRRSLGSFNGELADGDQLDPSAAQTRTTPAENELSIAALNSLDIQLPSRGVSFYFKSPRGKVNVTARPLETRFISRWKSAAIGIAIGLLAWLGCWIVMRISRQSTLRLLAKVGLFIGGLISITSGTLPIYGLLALVAASVLFTEGISRLFTPQTVTEN